MPGSLASRSRRIRRMEGMEGTQELRAILGGVDGLAGRQVVPEPIELDVESISHGAPRLGILVSWRPPI